MLGRAPTVRVRHLLLLTRLRSPQAACWAPVTSLHVWELPPPLGRLLLAAGRKSTDTAGSPLSGAAISETRTATSCAPSSWGNGRMFSTDDRLDTSLLCSRPANPPSLLPGNHLPGTPTRRRRPVLPLTPLHVFVPSLSRHPALPTRSPRHLPGCSRPAAPLLPVALLLAAVKGKFTFRTVWSLPPVTIAPPTPTANRSSRSCPSAYAFPFSLPGKVFTP